MDKCFACDKELGTLSWYSEVDDFNPPPKGMTKNDVICDQCAKEHKKLTNKNQSTLWYLLPIAFAALGGALMFVALRKENFDMAKNGLIVGIVLQVLGIFIVVGLSMFGMMASVMNLI
jgi:hypothetical protein